MAKRKRDDDDGTLVYSSGPDGARSFGPGGKVKDEAGSAASIDIPPAQQKLKLTVDTKAGRGKTITIVTGLVLTAKTLEKLAKELKQSCGSGGTVRGATIEVQGDHRDRLAKLLNERGFKVT